MSARAWIWIGLLAPACYVGESPQAGESSTGAVSPESTGAGPTGSEAMSQPTDGQSSETGPSAGTTSGTTDMSEGPGTEPAVSESSGGDSSTAGPGSSSESGEPPIDETAQLCARWSADRADLDEGAWDGDVNACNKGALSQAGRDNALRQVNLYRHIAGLPPVTEDPARSGKAQACALMMHANGALSHDPPMDWKCYSAEGDEAAGQSNISGGPGVFSVDLYMIDVGNETTMGHRRWILSNSLGGVGLGSTTQSSCLLVIGGGGDAGAPWMAWPPPGLVPLQAMHVETVGWSDVDAAGWTVQSDSIDLNAASVTVKEGGVDRPVTVNALGGGYGSASAVRFVPQGWKVEAGKTYDVALANVEPAIAYSVTIVDCG